MSKKKRRREKTEERRRVYRVERLPLEARDCVLNGFAAGKHYEEIRAELGRLGVKISAGALSNYWRGRWRFEEDRVRMARALAERIRGAMKEVSDTPLAVVGREMLFTKVFEKLKELDDASVWQLLREGRELARVTRGERLTGASEETKKELSAVEQARAIRRRWRELYGLEAGAEENEDDVGEDGQADSSPPEPGKGSE